MDRFNTNCMNCVFEPGFKKGLDVIFETVLRDRLGKRRDEIDGSKTYSPGVILRELLNFWDDYFINLLFTNLFGKFTDILHQRNTNLCY